MEHSGSQGGGKRQDKYTMAMLLQEQILQHRRRDVLEIPTEAIEPNPNQPRRFFEGVAMEELKQSIAQHGILEPLVVRPMGPGRYQIVIGERRWRCARDLGFRTVPAIVRQLSDEEAFELSLVENLQRDNLTPIEEARAYQHMIDSGMAKNQREVARILGIAPQRVNEKLRLLSLPPRIQERISARADIDPQHGTIGERHARFLLRLPTPELQEAAFEEIVKYGLTTRQTERLVQEMIAGGSGISEAVRKPRKALSFRRTQHGFRLRIEYDRRFHDFHAVYAEAVEALRQAAKEYGQEAGKATGG